MSTKINGKSPIAVVAYTRPCDPPQSQMLARACERWLRSRGLRTRRFQPVKGKKTPPVNPEPAG